MDNLTHSFIGLAASKAGLERLSSGTTLLCVLAANAPDADIVTLVSGRWAYLQHHRGITHSIVGTFALALALPLIFYLVDLLWARIRKGAPKVKLRGLLIASILVSATHPLMDWTNNYGVRFLLPWNSQWFYGDLVFIIDPLLWMALGGSVFLLTSKTKLQIVAWFALGLVTSYLVFFGPSDRGGLSNPIFLRAAWFSGLVALVVLFMQQAGKRWGERIPITAFAVVACYLAGLFFVHILAVRQAQFEAATIAAQSNEQVIKVAAMPTLANPLNWLVVAETDRAAYRFPMSLTGASRGSSVIRYEKPQGLSARATGEASEDSRAKVFLGFARFPIVKVVGLDCATQTLVQFADLRYTEPGRDRGTFSLELPVDCPATDVKPGSK
ncbi:MAG TPA: metal-dependent hydrolase [Pyrinomonadaceae bacterium]|nr:metal-dependent hydrolase [Pyrinomonadaceae bacterium]